MTGRLIPAHAGKTASIDAKAAELGAHPRSRGENDALSGASSAWKGSSPLTRGKRNDVVILQARRGLIPAHAGKTSVFIAARWRAWAHPRSRGENPPQGSFIFHDWGSSPLTRGKLAGAQRFAGRLGLIPAHAGKTS